MMKSNGLKPSNSVQPYTIHCQGAIKAFECLKSFFQRMEFNTKTLSFMVQTNTVTGKFRNMVNNVHLHLHTTNTYPFLKFQAYLIIMIFVMKLGWKVNYEYVRLEYSFLNVKFASLKKLKSHQNYFWNLI